MDLKSLSQKKKAVVTPPTTKSVQPATKQSHNHHTPSVAVFQPTDIRF
jgi:hypothetical protein